MLAVNRLIAASSSGSIISFDPETGNYQNQTSVGAGISVSPIVAGNTLYVLDDNVRLHAYR